MLCQAVFVIAVYHEFVNIDVFCEHGHQELSSSVDAEVKVDSSDERLERVLQTMYADGHCAMGVNPETLQAAPEEKGIIRSDAAVWGVFTLYQYVAETGDSVPYLVGTMIELPRAALRAQEIAEAAEFFSFGTNDLTQTTLGLSRDDAGRFLEYYVSAGIFERV